MSQSTDGHDNALGMDARISRRDFLNSTLIASAALLSPRTPAELLSQASAERDEWTGFGGVGDYAQSNGNTLPVPSFPAMMVNVAVRNWRFLERLGISGCRWFEGVGSFMQMRHVATFGAAAPTIHPDQPAVITLKVLYPSPGLPAEEQGHRGRAEMLATSFREYERRIRTQFDDMFGRAGLDVRRDIAGIILNRWGHAYVSPQPGWYYGANGRPSPREVLRAAPFGRIALANTDLSGNMDHRSSILEADRAVGQLLDQVLA